VICTEHRCGAHSRFAFYSSVVGGVTTDPSAMLVPLDDHMVHRGHAVFDTYVRTSLAHMRGTIHKVVCRCNVHGGRAYGLQMHLDRLFRSAAAAKIVHSYTKEDVANIVLVVCIHAMHIRR
jgi:4-amino-4-deoxychorismate lyase